MKKLWVVALFLAGVIHVEAQSYTGGQSISAAEKLNRAYCSPLFRYTDGTILDIENDPSVNGYFNILDWLSGRVAGLQIISGDNGMRIPLIRGNVPAIFVDEMPVSIGYLNTLPVPDIAMIKVIKTPFYGGFRAAAGAIAVYTFPESAEDTSLPATK